MRILRRKQVSENSVTSIDGSGLTCESQCLKRPMMTSEGPIGDARDVDLQAVPPSRNQVWARTCQS